MIAVLACVPICLASVFLERSTTARSRVWLLDELLASERIGAPVKERIYRARGL